MDKPKEAIERMRHFKGGGQPLQDLCNILAYLDSIPDEAVPVVWPKELTRERLEELAIDPNLSARVVYEALRALAALAPQRKKRVVNLWRLNNSHPDNWPTVFAEGFDPNDKQGLGKWYKVNKDPIEIDE